ncbi:hypothetical protein ACFQ60_06630 [Streptomyces zhihengii]
MESAAALTYLRDRCHDRDRWQPCWTICQPTPTASTHGPVDALAARADRHRLPVPRRPGDLLALHDPGALDRHLLARYIPAATGRRTATPRRPATGRSRSTAGCTTSPAI